MILPDENTQTGVLLIAHGSRHGPANEDLHQLAARFRTRGDYPIVEACFLELAEPDIATGGGRCVSLGATRVLMIPYFLSAGVHMLRDLTAARDGLRLHHPGVDFRLGTTLGPHPLLDAIVADRVRELVQVNGRLDFAPSADMARRYAPMDGDPSS